jgi:predicted TPR repeat methyltransferase
MDMSGMVDRLAAAVRDAEAGEDDGARRGFEAVLARDPAHAGALHRLGVLLHRQGDPAGAARLIGRSLAVAPGMPGPLSDLGAALCDLGRPGLAYLTLCAADDALPDDPRVKLRLAGSLIGLRRYGAAADALAAALAPQEDPGEAHHLLASVLYRILATGDRAEALARARAWVEAHPSNPLARHALAALGGAPAPAKAEERWVRLTFDRFAPDFDAHLAGLSYAVPERIAAVVRRCPPGPGLDIVDAGCGTGLCGALLRPAARRLVGVDLSPGMLAQACAKGVYDDLVETDLTAFLEATPASWDAIVAADVFIYIGDAEPALRAAARALRPGGRLIASFENADPDGSGPGYSLHPSGRYRHSAAHIDAMLASAGLRVVADEPVPVRLEMGAPIPGRIVAAAI